MYHFVCPANYRISVFSKEVDETLNEICLEISKRLEIEFLESGTDKNHVHFLIQSVPTYRPTKIIQTVKSISAREIFAWNPVVKKNYGAGNSGQTDVTSNTVSKIGSEANIRNYVRKQGVEEYVQIYQQDDAEQLTLI